VFIKANVLGSLIGVLGRVNFTQTGAGSGPLTPVPFCLPHTAPKTKKLAPSMQTPVLKFIVE